MIALLRLLGQSRRVLVGAVLLGLVSGLASVALLWLIGASVSQRLGAGLGAFAAFVGCGALALATRVVFMGLLGRLQQGAVLELRRSLVRRMLATPVLDLEQLGAARLHAALTSDVLMLGESLRFVPYFFINLATCLAAVAYLAWLSVPVFLALLGFAAVAVVVYWLPAQRSVRLLQLAREREDDLFKHFRALTDGLKELALHRARRAAYLAEGLDPTARELRRLHVRSNDIFSATSSWGIFQFFLFVGLLLFVVPQLGGGDRQVLTGYAFVVLYLQQPLSAVLELLPILGRGAVALRKLESLGLSPLGAAPPVAEPAPVEAPAFAQLRLTAVTHSYHREQEDDRFTLGPIDLTLARGELVFLVGGNGSGKTTLAKLLTGLYTPESGSIELDGVAVGEANREAYRQHFSAVFSDFHVFESLLGLPRDAATAARVQHYLAKLHLERKVTIAEGRFSTTSLSQGQRKRLALLAAYLEDRPIYLFDEWAADQDPTFKAVFYQELLPELRAAGKTVIVISHDDRYFHVADRVLRLELGRLQADAISPPAPSTALHSKGDVPCPPSIT